MLGGEKFFQTLFQDPEMDQRCVEMVEQAMGCLVW